MSLAIREKLQTFMNREYLKEFTMVNGYSSFDNGRTRYFFDIDMYGNVTELTLIELGFQTNPFCSIKSHDFRLLFLKDKVSIKDLSGHPYKTCELWYNVRYTEEEFFQKTLVEPLLCDLEYQDYLDMMDFFGKIDKIKLELRQGVWRV